MTGSIIHGASITQDLHETADVCIIGSGCGGAAAAKVLAEAGKNVLVVEEGGYYEPSSFQQNEEWAFTHLYVQRAGLSTENLSHTVLQGRCVGGSSTVNWTTSLRTPEFTLDRWVTEHGLSHLSPKELDPYFDRVERYLHVHAEPDGRHNVQNRVILDGAKALGYRAHANGRNVQDCAALGVCGLGCPAGEKMSADVTYIADAVRAGATVIADARAESIDASRSPHRVTGHILDRETRRPVRSWTVETDVVIIAGSATSSPLLVSAIEGFKLPAALGRHLTFHSTTAVLGVYATPQYAWKGIPQSAMCDEFLNKNGDGGGFWIEAAPFGPALASMSVPSFGKAHADFMAMLPYIAVSIVLVKEIDSSGTVQRSPQGRPVLSYNAGPRDSQYIRQGIREAARIHFAAGAREVISLHSSPVVFTSPGDIDRSLRRAPWGPNDLTQFSAHPLGTCRMGTNPADSVVDEHAQVHDVPGVFVIDGSILPSALGVNPQITILAVAERQAEWIADEWKTLSHT